MDQTKVTGYIAEKLSNQLADAKNAADRNQALKAAADVLDKFDDDRVHDKAQGVAKNEPLMDRVHISPKAEALYRADTLAAEKAHEPQQTKPIPEDQKGVLADMNADG